MCFHPCGSQWRIALLDLTLTFLVLLFFKIPTGISVFFLS